MPKKVTKKNLEEYYNDFEDEEYEEEEIKKRKAGRPRGTYKYEMPIQDYKKLQSRLNTLRKIRKNIVTEILEELEIKEKIDKLLQEQEKC